MGRHPPLERATLVGSSPRATVICVGVVLGLQGCTRRLQLFERADDATASGDADTGVEPDPGAKPGLERRLCIAGTAEDFRLPSARWGLSVAFASRKLGEPAGNQLRLRPEWFLASAWQSDYFGCGGYGTPWSADPSGTEGGCFALQSGTHWLEISRLFPETFELDAWPSMVDGDHQEASALALAHAVYAGHLLLRRIDDVDPDAWLASSADPVAATRLATLLHAQGPWSGSAAAAVRACADDVYDCTESTTPHYATQVERKLPSLEAAPCATIPVSEGDLVQDGAETVYDSGWLEIGTRVSWIHRAAR